MALKEIGRFGISHFQILDENGDMNRDLEPKIAPENLLRTYRAMVLAREADARMLKLQRQGRIGTFPPATGQEAASCGTALAMSEKDWFVGAFRDLGLRLMRGESLARFFLSYNGFEEGNAGGVARDLPSCIPIATHLPQAVGIAYAMAFKGEKDSAVVAVFGDGATSEGDFHESLNFAAVWRAPVVFVCQNNQWAISVPLDKQTASETIAQKAIAYGMPGIQVDGNDVLAVYQATRDALDRALRGDGPTLIEAKTYRLLMHTTADDPSRYRKEDEVQEWWKRDPIPRFRRYLVAKGLWDDAKQAAMEADIKAEIDAAVAEMEGLLKQEFKPDVNFDHIFGTKHAAIEKQREEFLRNLPLQREGGHG